MEKPAGYLSGVASYFGMSSSTWHYVVRVKTRDAKGAGTDNSVRCAFIAQDGKRTNDLLLDRTFVNDLEEGVEETFEFDEDNIGDLESMEIWMDSDSCEEDEWFCEYVLVTCHKNDTKAVTYPFPVHRWIETNKRYAFEIYDSSLPQEETSENRRQQRREEIADNKIAYKYKEETNGLPRTTEKLPNREVFSSDYKWDFGTRRLKLMMEKKIQDIFGSEKWDNFEDIRALYKRTFNLPRGWYQWKSDFKFGDQRLNGVNTTQIRRCDKIPSNFPVTNQMVSGFLDGQTLEQAIYQRRIYIVDLKVLQDCPQKEDASPLCCPLALFYANEDGELIPIAIQLFQQPSPENPIFLPSDPENKWLLVKMFFNNADCSVHQSCTHLGFTHLVCESIATAATQALSPSHPVYQIMAPHFLYLFAINSRAVGKLISPGEWIDQTMSMGADGLIEILKRLWGEWRMDREGWYPADIEARGVDDKELLPNYYSRDDQLLVHGAIWDYVRDVLSNVYDRNQKLKEDYEVQEFARLLVDKDHAGIQGVFGGGKFDDLEDLIKVVTTTIYIASVTHAAANFGQYDEYGFPPVYPAKLIGDVPKDKSRITIQDVISYLPDKEKTLSIMVVTYLLSERSTQALGDFEIQYLYQPKAVEAVKRFQEDLKEIGNKIDARNRRVKNPYPYLHPREIPNAISI